MPDNYNVLIALTASKVIVSWYLFFRNRLFDRINAAMYVPFVTLDLVQTALWFMIDPTDTAIECSVWNSRVTGIAMFILCGVPLGSGTVQFLVSQLLVFAKNKEEKQAEYGKAVDLWTAALNTDCPELSGVWPRRKLLSSLHDKITDSLAQCQFFLAACVAYLALRWNYPRTEDWTSMGFEWAFPGPVCTTLSENGFQVWPLAVFPHWTVQTAFLFCFFLAFSTYNYVAWPSLMSSVTDALGMCGIVIFFVVGPAFASIWAGLQSCGVFFALFEPMLFRSNRILDPAAMDAEAVDLRKEQGRFFWVAWHRFGMLKILPWDMKLEDDKDDAPAHGHGAGDELGQGATFGQAATFGEQLAAGRVEEGSSLFSMFAPGAMSM